MNIHARRASRLSPAAKVQYDDIVAHLKSLGRDPLKPIPAKIVADIIGREHHTTIYRLIERGELSYLASGGSGKPIYADHVAQFLTTEAQQAAVALEASST